MAAHAHSTRAPLFPLSAFRPPLLRPGLGRQPGPVSDAIRTMRQAEAEDAAIDAIQRGLDRYFAEAGITVDLDAALRSAGGAA